MKKLGIIRGKFLNKSDMQSYEPLVKKYDVTAFGSLFPYDDTFSFPTVKLLSPMDIPVFPYKMPLLNRLFIDAHHLYGLEKKLKGIDIIDTAETYFYYSKQAMVAKQRGWVKKIIVRVYENIPFNNEGILGRISLKKYIRAHADRFIAISKKSKKALEIEGVTSDKITVIGHGVDTSRFVPDSGHWEQLGRKNGGPLTILFVGRLEREKGVYELIEAFQLLSAKIGNPDITLMFVGKGTEEIPMKKTVSDLGFGKKVIFKSVPYNGMPDIYKTADIVVAPSKRTKTWEEQYNIALLEAQSMGLPIVTTRSGAIPENAGTCALYCKEGDVKSLCSQLQLFISSVPLRLRYGQMARNRAVRNHDIHIIADKLDSVYQSM